MNKMRIWLAASLLALAACSGGGGSAGTAPFGSGSGTGTGSGSETGGGTTPTAASVSDLVVEVNKPAVSNTGSDSVVLKATALDGNRNALKGVPVVFTADSDAILTGGSGVTGDDGTVEARLTIGANRANRVITVNAVSGSITRTNTVQVEGATLTGSAIPAIVNPGGAGKVQFRLVDKVGTAMAGQTIEITAAGLTPSSATGRTGANGDFEFTFTAPSDARTYTVSAIAAGATTDPAPSVQVQSQGTVGPVSGVITGASVSSNPSVVGTNANGSTVKRAEIRALFVGANNQPIRNVRVWFDLKGDENSVGGSFTAGSGSTPQDVLYSDASGVVTTAYVPGTRSSPTNGVTIRACYSSVDVLPTPANCTSSTETKLTITSEPLGVSIGTNGEVEFDVLNYHKRFVVSVVDASGTALPDVQISASVDLPVYRKGYWCVGDPSEPSCSGIPSGRYGKVTTDICANEDGNRNGILESGEDVNNSGRIEPGKSDVRIQLVQSTTRADGTVEVLVSYAKSFASWVDATITVGALGVSGSEGRAQYRLEPVPFPAIDIASTQTAPAFVVSPYGIGTCNMAP